MAEVGILHPGEMGAAIAAELAAAGHRVSWASAGRSGASRSRAGRAGLDDAGRLGDLLARCETVISICPPHAALDVAREVGAAGFEGLYLDANAVSPMTAAQIDEAVEWGGARYVDGGIVGPPPDPGEAGEGPRLYLSGAAAGGAARLFEPTGVRVHVLEEGRYAASGLKMLYAAWTKGSAALLYAVGEAARAAGLEDSLRREWRGSHPELEGRLAAAGRDARAKGWRWAGEMGEIAETMDALGLPAGFHEAAATVFAGEAQRLGKATIW